MHIDKNAYPARKVASTVSTHPASGEPETTITKSPKSTTTDRTPTFQGAADVEGSTFECKLDQGSFKSCTSPKTYGKQGFGRHTFKVRATSPAGVTDRSPASKNWTIERP